jgi:hypothetical protein
MLDRRSKGKTARTRIKLSHAPAFKRFNSTLTHLQWAYDPPYHSVAETRSDSMRRSKRSKQPAEEKLFALAMLGEVVELAESQHNWIIGRVKRRTRGWEEFLDVKKGLDEGREGGF